MRIVIVHILALFMFCEHVNAQSLIQPKAPSCGPFSTEAQAAIDEYPQTGEAYMSCEFKQAIADFVDELIADGNWDERISIIWSMVEHGGNAYTDISGNNNDASVGGGSITVGWTEGWVFDGTNDEYVASGFTPSTDHNNLAASDDVVYIVFVNEADGAATSSIVYYFGARDSQSPDKSQVGMFDDSRLNGEIQAYHHNDGGAVDNPTTAVVDNTFYGVMRNGTTNTVYLKVQTGTTYTNASSAPNGGLLQREIAIGAIDIEGSILYECSCTIGGFMVFKASTLNYNELINAAIQFVADVDAITN